MDDEQHDYNPLTKILITCNTKPAPMQDLSKMFTVINVLKPDRRHIFTASLKELAF